MDRFNSNSLFTLRASVDKQFRCMQRELLKAIFLINPRRLLGVESNQTCERNEKLKFSSKTWAEANDLVFQCDSAVATRYIQAVKIELSI